jgi:eukaryotic-like serine/threonine-protein kinase
MSLSTGQRLGPYEVLAPLGAGGMGEVYRARDTRLSREVAIKVLPAAVSSDPERLKRFEKEARSASSLNHPNIVTIYDIGESGGASYIAMELVGGQTLRDLLAEGALPAKRLLAIAAQVADGLAKAHGAGIAHRDLKPENVMVTKDGFVKILDFGLAKLTQPDAPEGQKTHAPTVSAGTEPGVVMGTVAYMSPEQALGKAIDFHSDQFSFGSVLYEMATGKQAFARGNAPETLAAIIREEPEAISTSAPSAPVPLRWAIERCLAKDPEERYASTRDLARDLARLREGISEGTLSGGSFATVAPSRFPSGLLRAALVLLGGVAIGAAVVAVVLRRPRMPAAPILRTSLLPPEGRTFRRAAVALSPDGRQVAFGTLDSAGNPELWIRSLAQPEARHLSNLDDARNPFWSPDGRLVGFFSSSKLQTIEAAGGAPRTVCEVQFGGRGGTWNRDGVVLFAPGPFTAIFRVSAAGGEPAPVTRLDSGRKELSHRWPSFLPDGRHFLFLSMATTGDRDVAVFLGSLDSPEVRLLVRAYSSAVFAPPGYLLFVDASRTLVALPFDAESLRVSGAPIPVAEGVLSGRGGTGKSGFSATGPELLAYLPHGKSTRIVWFDRSGREVGTVGPPGDHGFPRLSPDGKKVAVGTESAKNPYDVWVHDLSRGTQTRLMSDEYNDEAPVWSPDGRQIAFTSSRTGRDDLYAKDSNGTGDVRLLLHSDHQLIPDDWSPDGRLLLYDDVDPKGSSDLWVLPLFGDRKPYPFVRTKAPEGQARFSPDGRWVAYWSGESGVGEIYVLPFPGPGDRWQVSTGGWDPVWRRDGKELFYLSGDGVVAVDVKMAGSTLETGPPRPLFRLPPQAEIETTYDVSPDGQRFLTIVSDKEARLVPITLMQNWAAGLSVAGPRP